MSRPSLLWEVLDDTQSQRFQNRMANVQWNHLPQATRFLPSGVILSDSAKQDDVASDDDTTRSRCNAIICSRILRRI